MSARGVLMRCSLLAVLVGAAACTTSGAPALVDATEPDAAASVPRVRVLTADRDLGIYVVDVGSHHGAEVGDTVEILLDGEPQQVVLEVVHPDCSFGSADGRAFRSVCRPVECSGIAPLDTEVTAVLGDGTGCRLAVGTGSGVTLGLEFTVHRDGEYVATVVVEAATPSSCDVCIKDGLQRLPIRVGDLASTVL